MLVPLHVSTILCQGPYTQGNGMIATGVIINIWACPVPSTGWAWMPWFISFSSLNNVLEVRHASMRTLKFLAGRPHISRWTILGSNSGKLPVLPARYCRGWCCIQQFMWYWTLSFLSLPPGRWNQIFPLLFHKQTTQLKLEWGVFFCVYWNRDLALTGPCQEDLLSLRSQELLQYEESSVVARECLNKGVKPGDHASKGCQKTLTSLFVEGVYRLLLKFLP